jgi:acetyl esterase/lipase
MAVVESIEVEQDVVCGRAGSKELLCDIYRPAPARTKRTAVIHLHGGGFLRGNKAGARMARPLAELGYTCVSSSYRLADEAAWPAQIHDVKTCIRWVRTHAGSLDVEANRVVLLGYSAGARLTVIAGGTQNEPSLEGDGGLPGVGTQIAACVAFYPPAVTRRSHPVLGPEPSEEAIRTFSPIEQVKPGFPPTMLLHGTADTMVAVDESVQLYQALRQAGAPVELHVVEGMTHVFDSHADVAAACGEWIDLFLDRHVVNPRAYPSTEPAR